MKKVDLSKVLTPEEAKEWRDEVRARALQIPCTNYLRKSAHGNYICPLCESGKREKKTGAVKYYADTNKWYCHKCHNEKAGGKACDTLDLIRITNGAADYNTALELAAQEVNLSREQFVKMRANKKAAESQPAGENAALEGPKNDENGAEDKISTEGIKAPETASQSADPEAPEEDPDFTEYYFQCKARRNDPEALSYLQARGISAETVAACNFIGYDPEADPAGSGHKAKRIIFFVSKSHYIGRRIDGREEFKKLNNKGGSGGVTNGRALRKPENKVVFVVEGATDALSIMEAGRPAVSINSTSNASAFIDYLEEHPTKATLIISFDNDKAGKTATDILRNGLQRLNISYIVANISGEYNDPNEALMKDRAAFIAAVNSAVYAASARPDNVQYYINSVMGDDIERFKTDIVTGFNNLDTKSGGLYSGLYILAAISSLGKTTFAAQIADQIAAAGHDVLFFSLEQSRLEIVSKSLARWIAKKDHASTLTSLAIRKGRSIDTVRAAAKEYTEAVKDRLSVIEGNFNCNISFIGDYIRHYMRQNEEARPVVMLDYLQILQPETDKQGRRQSTKEVIDETITALKRLSREMNIVIFAISSVNRANYLTPIDFESLKESGGIEYSADVVWGLQLQCITRDDFAKMTNIKDKRQAVKTAKAKIPREIELVCLKNRYGIANYSCYFDYYPNTDLFTEKRSASFDFSSTGNTSRRR